MIAMLLTIQRINSTIHCRYNHANIKLGRKKLNNNFLRDFLYSKQVDCEQLSQNHQQHPPNISSITVRKDLLWLCNLFCRFIIRLTEKFHTSHCYTPARSLSIFNGANFYYYYFIINNILFPNLFWRGMKMVNNEKSLIDTGCEIALALIWVNCDFASFWWICSNQMTEMILGEHLDKMSVFLKYKKFKFIARIIFWVPLI